MARAVVDAAGVDAARAHLAELAARPGGGGPLVTAPVERDSFFLAFAACPVLTALAALALGCVAGEVLPFGCTYVVKAARTGPPALWHQDGYPWETELVIARAVTVWVALDDADAGNGGLVFIPGSHRTEATPLRPSLRPPNVFGCELDPALVAAAAAVRAPLAVDLRAGDVSAHHPHVVHSSPPNTSPRERRALAIRYRAA